MSTGGPLREGDPRRLGPYEISSFVGEGGQGAVYRGHDPSGRAVAIKVLRTLVTADPDALRLFTREVALARQVAGFCTAQVLDDGVADGRPYVVTEFINGPSLEERVQREGPRGGGRLEQLAISTLTALAAIHRAGIVHRDFKPSNVLLGPEGPVVIDFGIARSIQAAVTTASIRGTPSYMSPEQVTGDLVGTASDVFSWAATMAFAATGRHLFAGEHVQGIWYAVLHQEPDLAGVPEPLASLLTACLAKDAAHRPGVAEARHAVENGDPSPSRPIGRPESPRAYRTTMTDSRRVPPPPPPTHPGPASLPAKRDGRRIGLVVGAVGAAIILGTLLIVAPRLLSAGPGSDGIPRAYAGTWEGVARQTGQKRNSRFRVRITLTAGADGGTLEIPHENSPPCQGDLELIDTASKKITLEVTFAAGDCLAGTVVLTKRADSLGYRWTESGGPARSSATLRRGP